MKIVTIVGARPQFIKSAVVSRAIEKHNSSCAKVDYINEIIVHTGQHFDKNMSDIFFKELDIPLPNYELNIHGLSHGEMTGKMMEKIESVLLSEKPDIVIVYGDTNSTMAGALAATKIHIPVSHVEAGLRSFNRRMPEEINRIVTDHVSTILFCPTKTAVNNLNKEGFKNSVHKGIRISFNHPTVVNVGDVMYDSVLHYSKMVTERSYILEKLNVLKNKFGLVTIHRAENTDDPAILEQIIQGLKAVSKTLPLIWPVHPRIKKCIDRFHINSKDVQFKMIDPVGYFDIMNLEKNSNIIFTDSGGVQKEAYFLNVPCVTLRDETEWIETVESGANILAGFNPTKIIEAHRQFHTQNSKAQQGLFGDGNAGDKIVQTLVDIV